MGKNATDKKADLTKLAQTPLAILYCPSRRPAVCYPNPYNPDNINPVSIAAHTDYAGNSGTYAPTTNADWWTPDESLMTGVIYGHSEVRMAQIVDGLSCTYLLGEKYLTPDHYGDGVDDTNCKPIYTGYDWEGYCCEHFRALARPFGVRGLLCLRQCPRGRFQCRDVRRLRVFDQLLDRPGDSCQPVQPPGRQSR